MAKSKLRAYILIVFSMLFWGMSFVWTKIVFKYLDPISTVLFRLIISSVLLLIVFKIWGKLQKIDRKHYGYFLLLALFEPFFYFLGENFGLQKVSPSVASIIIATIPLLTPIIGHFFLKEKITKFNIIGVFVSFSGILLMIMNKNLELTADPAGIGLLFVAVFSAVGYSAFLSKLSGHYNSMTIITCQNIVGIFLFLPLFLIFDLHKIEQVTFTRELILSLLQLSIFASSIAFMFYISVVKELGTSRSNIFTNLIPVFTAIFSFFLLNEEFTLIKVAGMLVVLTGLFISQRAGRNSEELRIENY